MQVSKLCVAVLSYEKKTLGKVSLWPLYKKILLSPFHAPTRASFNDFKRSRRVYEAVTLREAAKQGHVGMRRTRRGSSDAALVLLLAALLPASAQPPPGTVDVASYAQLFDAVVNQQAPSVRVVSHISFASASDSVNVSSAVSIFGDAALCAASAAALDANTFSVAPASFETCTLDGAGAPWRHFTVYAPGLSNFTDLRRGVERMNKRACSLRPSAPQLHQRRRHVA